MGPRRGAEPGAGPAALAGGGGPEQGGGLAAHPQRGRPPAGGRRRPGGADPQAEAERREWAARLWDAVEGLDEPDRTLFLRYYYYGDKLKDIARALGLTQTAAKQRLFRGRKALRDTLTKGGVEA